VSVFGFFSKVTIKNFCSWLASLLSFSRDGNYVNLARSDPSLFTISSNRLCLRGSETPCICLSFIHITDSCLSNPKYVFNDKKTGVAQHIKYICGIHHSVEWERLQSTVHAVFNVDSLHAQVQSGILTFGTRAGSLANDGMLILSLFHTFYITTAQYLGNAHTERFAGTSSAKLFVASPRKTRLPVEDTSVPRAFLSVNDNGMFHIFLMLC
jgi:hypothetical protein